MDMLLVSKYAQTVVDHLYEALRRETRVDSPELPRIPTGSSGRGSARYVDFLTCKPTYPADKCHINAMAADFPLDTHPAVVRWVKNEHLGLRIPYRKDGVPSSYLPDFVAILAQGLNLLIEVKGSYEDDADRNAKAAERWVAAVNRVGDFGTGRYSVVKDPPALTKALEDLSPRSRTEGAMLARDPCGRGLDTTHDLMRPKKPGLLVRPVKVKSAEADMSPGDNAVALSTRVIGCYGCG